MEDLPIVSSLEPSESVSKPSSKTIFIIAAVAVVILGSALGVFAASRTAKTSEKSPVASGTDIKTEKEVGSTNPAFKDEAAGKLEKGGLNGEGTHHLVRSGGPSQTVYLVSSVVDLDQFDGKNVQVTGQTLRAKSVGWLMDVGRVKITD